MPLYEYKCKHCGQVFEVMQRFSDDPLVTHEGCGGTVERLLSAPALQYKGSGWYITDYQKSGASNSKSKESGSPTSSKSEGGSGSSTSSSSSTTSSSSSSDTK